MIKLIALMLGFKKAELVRGRFYFAYEKHPYSIQNHPDGIPKNRCIGIVFPLPNGYITIRCEIESLSGKNIPIRLLHDTGISNTDGKVRFTGKLPDGNNAPLPLFIGNIIDLCWLWYKHGAKIIYPGVAELPEEGGAIGFHARGNTLFRKGDKIFDARWMPLSTDLLYYVWSEESAAGITNHPYEIWLKNRTPFSKRGSIKIKTQADAIQAAWNFYQYMNKLYGWAEAK